MSRQYEILFNSKERPGAQYTVIFKDPNETGWSVEAADLSYAHAEALMVGLTTLAQVDE